MHIFQDCSSDHTVTQKFKGLAAIRKHLTEYQSVLEEDVPLFGFTITVEF